MQIIDNFLPKEEFEQLHSLFCGRYMDWYCHDCVNTKGDGYFQFNHRLYDNHIPRGRWKDIRPILNKLEPRILTILRVKANLLTRTSQHDFHGYHVDIIDAQGLPNLKTAIYYCNTTNGYTQFEDETKVDGIQNRMVIFDGDKKHSSVSQTDEPYRVVINFNWLDILSKGKMNETSL